MVLRICAFVFIIVTVCALPPPSYIIPCSKSDPDFMKCALEHGRSAIPFIVQGDKTYKLPPLNPLQIPFVQLGSGLGLQLNITDLKLHGLDKAVLEYINIDLKAKTIEVTVSSPKLNLEGMYSIQGRLAAFNLQGTGPGEINFYNGNYTYSMECSVAVIKGKEYLKIETDKMKLDIGNVAFHLETLFKDNKAFGLQINKFLTENWKQVFLELGDTISDTVRIIIRNVVKGLFQKIPMKDLFLE